MSRADGVDHRSFYPSAGETARLMAEFDAVPLADLKARACAERDRLFGSRVSYSPKVFIPLTRLCMDSCGYCTFSKTPRSAGKLYLTPEDVLDIARAGAESGCSEALFTLGERPELRYRAAQDALKQLGYDTTLSYLAAMADLVQRETGLLAHLNPGTLNADEVSALRRVSASQGLMLETVSEWLCAKGGPHHGAVTKRPERRIETIALAGQARVPFTSGILIGIGESRAERIESLLVLRNLNGAFGHIQEVIIQNFRAKPDTRMAESAEPDFEELLWTTAVARLVLGAGVHLQVPPNLSFERFPELLDAGIDDWGGVSPVTPDHVNPEAPWPARERLAAATRLRGMHLVARLPLYPEFVARLETWVDDAVRPKVRQAADADGLARDDRWSPGVTGIAIDLRIPKSRPNTLDAILARAAAGQRLDHGEIRRLFMARGDEIGAVIAAADIVRRKVNGDVVSYTVNRNINYTNICEYRCAFCAFSKGKTSDALRGKPYNISEGEVARRAVEAWARGATEVCMQGGIHPNFTGDTYLRLLAAVKRAVPEMHVHAFSPLEVWHGASTLDIALDRFIAMLRDAGLGSLPGTAAEILDDGIRATLCPDKISTEQWLAVVRAAHRAGVPTTATVMFGHMEGPQHWATHLLHIRDLQEEMGGFTEFVPLPFVHMEAPLFYRGWARKGPTSRETILMHAVARLALHPLIPNIQTSWVKLGREGVAACLSGGANDLGGTLMNESISRAAGTEHGQEFPPQAMEELIVSLGRTPFQRTTLYAGAPRAQQLSSYEAAPLQPVALELTGIEKRPRSVAQH